MHKAATLSILYAADIACMSQVPKTGFYSLLHFTAHLEMHIWMEYLGSKTHTRGHQRILLWNIDGKLKGATFKRGVNRALIEAAEHRVAVAAIIGTRTLGTLQISCCTGIQHMQIATGYTTQWRARPTLEHVAC
jgi:hypothetical protein